MKKNKASIVFAILSVFLFLGCVKELPSPVDGMIFRQYSATISGGTKTEDKGSGKVDWTKGDIIQYWSSDNGRIGTHTVAASGHTEKIKAEVGIDDEYLVAVYGGGTASDNSALGFILSDAICAEQTGAFEDAHISVAKTEKITSGTLQFRNVTSLIKFSINKTNVRKVVISANNGEKIHGGGRISVSTKNSSPIASFVDGGGSEISVSVSGPGTFYISTLPVTLSKGFTVSLYGTSNQLIGVISRSASLTIKANTILDLGTLVPITEISIDKKSLVLEEGETESLTAIFYPEDATSKKITWSSDNESIATVDQSGKVTALKAGSATITVTTTDGGYTATCSVTVKSPEPATPEMVDLGLSVKWASFNLGAIKPEEYGDYYQWAGLEDVTSTSIYLDWNNCPYHTGSDDKIGWTKYIPSYESSYWSGTSSPDNKTVLDPEDDIAHVTLGGKWRMPTLDEWTELKNNCTWTWTTQNGVAGHKVTSKKSGYTSKSIFLPAAGCREDNDLYGVGSAGFYLSSSLTNHPADAYELYFDSVRMGERGTRRCRGRSARPVYGDRVSVAGVSLSKTSLSLEVDAISTLNATVTPSNAAEKSVSWSSSNTGVATVDQSGKVTAVKAGSATITVTTTDGGYTATCSVTVKSAGPAVPEAVDLGLSVKWASFNIGASKPEEYGGYYQWAGLDDVTSSSIYLDWSNCPYHNGSNADIGWIKYVPSNKSSYWSGSGSPDNKTVLEPSDDVAHVKLGGKWRMPTLGEWNELKSNCTWTWTQLNGVNGYKVTSNISGYTDKYIFLPAAGYRYSDHLYSVGSYGNFWSSSLNTSRPYGAYFLYFFSDLVSTGYYYGRYFGLSVRPVYGDRISVTGVSLNTTSLSLNIGETSTLSATVTPSNAAEKSVSWSSSNTGVATVDQSGTVTALKGGSATITVTTTDGGYTATCSVTVKSAGPDVPEAVDLGLPSGIKWASFNLGASSPEGYGGYYQWAGLEDVTSTSIYLDWSNCPFHTGSSSSTGWTKYVPSNQSPFWSGSGNPDNKTVLDPEDDIAHVTLGGKWRMATKAEFEELYNNCTSEWTTLNGVDGRKFTSKKNGNCIFLPAAGFRSSDYLYYAGSCCYYWSSSLSGNPRNAYSHDFYSFNVDAIYDFRSTGRSVRPVYGDRISVTGVSLNTKGLSLNIGETSTLSATVTPSNVAEKSVSWSSSNTGVATVDQSGKVTAVKAGSATITVTTTDGGYTATCSVTVKETEPYFVIDGQSNYSVDAGGGEFQFIVKSNVEWILKDYHDSSYPWQKTTISKNGNEATVKVIIEANTEYSSRESYIKFTVPSIQDPILDENGQATGETTDHIEKVYFKQSGLANVAWETVLPSGTKRENQLSIAKGSSTYLLCDGNSFYSFNQKTGAVTTATIPSIGEEIVEITNDDAGNLLLATSTEFGKTFDIYAIPAGTSIGANTNPSLIIHSNSDINGVGPGHITARGNVFEEGIITALVTCWDSAFGAYWEIEKGKATAQPRYVTINIQNLWSPLSAAFSPLGISASSGFIYNGYDGMYNYVYIDKNGSSKKIGSRGDWDAGVNCIVPSFWGNEPIVVANVMSYFPEQYPSYIEIYKLNSMDPVASIQIKTSNGSNNTGRSSCIMLENENGDLIIYCADGSQNVLSKITIPSKYHL